MILIVNSFPWKPAIHPNPFSLYMLYLTLQTSDDVNLEYATAHLSVNAAQNMRWCRVGLHYFHIFLSVEQKAQDI